MTPDAPEILRALEAGEFFPVFQPLVELRTGQLAGFEVLARWQSPHSGLVMPDDFIPAFEHSGFIDTLTHQLLGKTFDALSLTGRPLMISVNLSPTQLLDAGLPARLETLARAWKFPLDRLTLEITESALVDDLPRATSVAQDLKSLQCRLALDDFGTGYSSLRHLQALPFDELKVDRSFVRFMDTDRECRKIVASVVGLGQSLGLMTIAEGVEDSAQAEMLRWLSCDLAQGWLFGHPVPAGELPAILARPHWDSLPASFDGTQSTSRFQGDAVPAHRLAQLQAIYDGAPVGLCFLDRNLRYVNLNRQLAEMNGVPAAAHVGRSVEEVIPHIFPSVEPFIRRALQGEATNGVEVTKPPGTPGSQPQTVMLSYHPVRDEAGDVLGVSVAIMDISDQKNTEEALRRSEDHYRHWISLSPNVPWVLDGDGKVVDASSRWTEFTGQPIDQAMGDGWLRMLHPDDVEPTRDAIRNGLHTHLPVDVKYRVRRPGEDWSWMRSRGSPRLDAEGRILSIYGVVEPIVPRKEISSECAFFESELNIALDAMPVGMILADGNDGVIFKVNACAHQFFGNCAFPGQRLDEYVCMGLLDEHGRAFTMEEHPLARSILRGDRLESLPVLHRQPDGSLAHLYVSSRPIFSDQQKIVGGMMMVRGA
ncbi:EAL domain-containing protein [Occallatibacter riparius]|uniref:EAL domain-containing protein n=1 Tax=Occallatibacter riparius TaxID=1002689 RepID=A0A9J7BWI2_9BACT|nr:EAL domain-containing protein [Occallatibacter riparius]UWZ86170.1 EAL domain-containing protein [Occallatibacter riparius]